MDLDVLMESSALFRTTFPGSYAFTWRLLTLKEYTKFRALRDSGSMHPFMLHNLVFERCYVGEVGLLHRDMPAGITIAVGECIMWLSGDCELESLVNDIELARMHYPTDGVKEFMKRIVFTAFPAYVEEDADGWTYPELIRKFTISEAILVNRGLDYQPLDTRKITLPGQETEKTIQPGAALGAQRRGETSTDFRGENRELSQALGQQSHPLDMDPADFAKMQDRGKGRLTRKLARQLDRKKQTRG